MVKKTTTIKIDEELLDLAKNNIPNLSGFVDMCLRKYLGLDDDLQITSVQEELDKIKEANLNIHFLIDMNTADSINLDLVNKKKNEAWLRIWSNYRNTETYHLASVNNASEVLEVPSETIIDLMEFLIVNVPKQDLIQCDDWGYCWELYNE